MPLISRATRTNTATWSAQSKWTVVPNCRPGEIMPLAETLSKEEARTRSAFTFDAEIVGLTTFKALVAQAGGQVTMFSRDGAITGINFPAN